MHRNLLASQCVNELPESATEPVNRKLRTCANVSCKELFRPQRDWQRFCSTGCHNAYHLMARQIGIAALDAVHGLKIAKGEEDDQ